MAKKNKNEQIFLNLIKTTEEFKVSYKQLKENASTVPYEDERLEMEKKYYVGYIHSLFELIERNPLLLTQYYEVIKNDSKEMLIEMLGNKYEALLSVSEKTLLNEKLEVISNKKIKIKI